MAVPTDNNMPVKEYDKRNKCKNLDKEIEKKMWHRKSITMLAIVGALGMINKRIDKNKDT